MTTLLGVLLAIAAINAFFHGRRIWADGHWPLWVALEFIGAVIILTAAVLLTTGVVHAQEVARSTIDFNPVVGQLVEVVVSLFISLAGILALWLASLLKKKWGIDIEAQVRAIETMHRGTLHSAVETWTKAAVAKYGPDLTFDVDNAALRFILEGVRKSAPEAIAALGATEGWIANKAAGVAGVTPVVAVS